MARKAERPNDRFLAPAKEFGWVVARGIARVMSVLCVAAITAGSVLHTDSVFAQDNLAPSYAAPTVLTDEVCANPNHHAIALMLSAAENQKAQAYMRGATFRVDAINAAGGLRGKPICLLAYDDRRQVAGTVATVNAALSNPKLIAMLGINSSSRAEAVVQTIGSSGVPLISDISVDRLFADHANIFTISKSVTDDTRAFRRFMNENYKSALFIGNQVTARDGRTKMPDLFARSFLDALTDGEGPTKVHAVRWIEAADQATLDAIVADIRLHQPDVLAIAAWTGRGTSIVKRLQAEGIRLPIFFATGDVYSIIRATGKAPYPGALFQIGGRIPGLVSERLADLNKRADIRQLRDELDNYIGDGIIFYDLVTLLGEAAGQGSELDAPAMRRQIREGLHQYRQGRRIFPGLWRNWSFTAERASARDSFIFWAPNGAATPRLWGKQAIRSQGGLIEVPVAYVGIDLVRLHSIDTNEQRFDAEFYLSLSSSAPITLDRVAFSNAVKGGNGQPLVQITAINTGRSVTRTPAPSSSPASTPNGTLMGTPKDQFVRLYNVKGRFQFVPTLSQYPFDIQRFSVAFKPVDTQTPFLIQPPEPRLQDRVADIDGWTFLEGSAGQYVGSEQEIITTIRNHATERHIQPYYKFNFSWVAKRQTIDYYVRVVIPLTLIMMVAYFAVFLPSQEVSSVVAMQVTSLLATIALYFSLPKINTETATLSDQIFVFAEAVIVLMILISIIRTNLVRREHRKTAIAMKIGQAALFPMLVAVMFFYVRGVSLGEFPPITELSRI